MSQLEKKSAVEKNRFVVDLDETEGSGFLVNLKALTRIEAFRS